MNTWVKKMPAVAITLAFVIAVSPVSLAYARAASTGSVSASVKVANSDTPLAGVTVRLLDMNTAELFAELATGEDGSVSLVEIPFGLYQVSVVAPEGYLSAAGPLVVLDAETTLAELSFALEPVPAAVAPAAAAAPSTPVLVGILIGGAIGGALLMRNLINDSTS